MPFLEPIRSGDAMDLREGTESHPGRTVAVVLTHRRPRLATQSVRFLLDEEGMAPEDVIVVVNGDGGLADDELAQRVNVHTLESNRGPAGGMLAGLVAATEDPDVEWIYLCEDDIGASGLPAPRLDRLRRLAGDRAGDAERRGPIGGIVAYGRQLDGRTGLTRPHIPTDDDTGLVPTDVAGWGASLVARAVVDAGVLPNESLFFGYEDFDFWLSVRAAGFDVVLDVECARELGLSVHPSGREATLGSERTIDDTEPWRRYYEARNYLHLRRTHGRITWTFFHLAKSFRRGMLGSGPHRRAIVAGLVDGVRRRDGLRPEYLRSSGASEHSATPVTPPATLPVTGPADPPDPFPPESAPPIFIVGCGRSGTTLLRAMLDSHPDVAVPPESYFVVALLKQRGDFEKAGALDRAAFLDELTRTRSFGEWDLDRSALESWPAFVAATDVPMAIRAIYGCYADRAGTTRTVDKTPFLGPNIGLLAGSFPGARFVHLVRDGRNVAQSLAEMEFGPGSLGGGILEWRRQVDAVDRHAAEGWNDVLCVRYEDLVADPHDVLDRICGHIGIEFDDAMLSYPERAEQVLAGLTRTAHLDGIRHAPTTDPRSWREQLSAEQLTLLEGLAEDALDRHGYELVGTRSGRRDRIRIARCRLDDSVRTVRLGLGARRARHLRRRRLNAGS